MFRKPNHEQALEIAIAEILMQMKELSPTSDEYAQMLHQTEKLYALKKTASQNSRISPDTLATITANLAGIVLILHYEKINVVASKALSFVQKLR